MKQDDAVSPSEYAKKTKQRLQLIYKHLESNQEAAQMAYKEQYDKNANADIEFPIDSRVWLNDPTHKVGLSKKLQIK